MATKVFVSPGVYTSEKDLTFITRQVGVTTLGLVGETTIGPAFQPIFISDYGEFQSFFGGLNATKVKDNGAPKYELPYIAKSYLSQSNQLFVTRVLGLSGYDAGYAWGLTLDAALDPSTSAATGGATYAGGIADSLITFSATSGGTIITMTSAEPIIQALISDGTLTGDLAFLGLATTGNTADIAPVFLKIGNTFSGVSFTLYVTTAGLDGSFRTGTTSGVTITYSGSGYAEVENQLVALLRSRGTVDVTTQLPVFEVTGSTVIFDPAFTGATENPLGDFSLSGFSATQGAFDNLVSLDRTKKNYLSRVLGRDVQNGNTPLYIEEFFDKMFDELVAVDKVRGVNQAVVNYNKEYFDYLNQYQPAVTPFVVSELRGTKLLKLFRFWTISDGNAANEQFKISIRNIKLDTREFDVIIRSYFDTDAQPLILESFSRCTMDPTSNNFVGRRIGTLDGLFPSKSSFVLVEMDDTSDTSDAFPAGFLGIPHRNYQITDASVVDPILTYKTTYSAFENKRKFYLGLSETVGIDNDFFDYKGVPDSNTLSMWTGMTDGFHMDIGASAATIDNVFIVINSSGDTFSPVFLFDVGNAQFRTEAGVVGTDYEKIYARKFTFAPYGGYDGWDIYRTRRSNLDGYTINGTQGAQGLTVGTFTQRPVPATGDLGINSDYYAYLDGIYTFRNPEAININVFATPVSTTLTIPT